MAIYFDFEPTAPTDNWFDPEQKKNVCYVLCFNCCISSAPEPSKNYFKKTLRALIRAINNV